MCIWFPILARHRQNSDSPVGVKGSEQRLEGGLLQLKSGVAQGRLDLSLVQRPAAIRVVPPKGLCHIAQEEVQALVLLQRLGSSSWVREGGALFSTGRLLIECRLPLLSH